MGEKSHIRYNCDSSERIWDAVCKPFVTASSLYFLGGHYYFDEKHRRKMACRMLWTGIYGQRQSSQPLHPVVSQTIVPAFLFLVFEPANRVKKQRNDENS